MKKKVPYTCLRYLVDMLKPYKLLLFGVVLLVILETFMTILWVPNALENITNLLVQNKFTDYKLLYTLGIFVILQMSMTVIIRLQDFLLDIQIIPKLSKRVIQAAMKCILHKNHRFFKKNHSGLLSDYTARLAEHVPQLTETLLSKLLFLYLSFLLVIYHIYTINRLLALLYAVFFIFINSLIMHFNREAAIRNAHYTKQRGLIAAHIVDLLRNILSVKLFRQQKQERKKLDNRLNHVMHSEKKVAFSLLNMSNLLGISYFVFQGLMFYLLSQQIKQGAMSTGAFVAVLYRNEVLMNMLWYDIDDITSISKDVGIINRGLRKIYMPEDNLTTSDKAPLIFRKGHITFDHVTFHMASKQHPLFTDLVIDIPPGQKVGLVGFSGAGKTTFLKLLLGLYPPTKGQICIDGQNIAHIMPASLYQKIGFVPQDPQLFCRSVRENIIYGNPCTTDEALMALAKQLRIENLLLSQTGEHTEIIVSERNTNISGGQRQRVAIARLILQNPSILVLDEATSQLDNVTAKSIYHRLASLAKDKTVIISTHHLNVLEKMDRILVFDKGRIVEDGTHDALLANNGLYTHLYNTQCSGIIVPDTPPSPSKT